MEFADREPIYLQIRSHMTIQILEGIWKAGDRVPSVRDLAVGMEVNPNTVARTYTLLQDEGILENRRGIGYFVGSGARAQVLKDLESELETHDLPKIFKRLAMAGMKPAVLADRYSAYLESKGTAS